MKLYRMITGVDDSEFCHRVSAAISAGWEPHGSASLTYDSARNRVICGQAIVKNVPDEDYTPDTVLSDY